MMPHTFKFVEGLEFMVENMKALKIPYFALLDSHGK